MANEIFIVKKLSTNNTDGTSQASLAPAQRLGETPLHLAVLAAYSPHALGIVNKTPSDKPHAQVVAADTSKVIKAQQPPSEQPANNGLRHLAGVAVESARRGLLEPLVGGSQIVEQIANSATENLPGVHKAFFHPEQYSPTQKPVAPKYSAEWFVSNICENAGKLPWYLLAAKAASRVPGFKEEAGLLSQRSLIGLNMKSAAASGFVIGAISPTDVTRDGGLVGSLKERTMQGTIGAGQMALVTLGTSFAGRGVTAAQKMMFGKEALTAEMTVAQAAATVKGSQLQRAASATLKFAKNGSIASVGSIPAGLAAGYANAKAHGTDFDPTENVVSTMTVGFGLGGIGGGHAKETAPVKAGDGASITSMTEASTTSQATDGALVVDALPHKIAVVEGPIAANTDAVVPLAQLAGNMEGFPSALAFKELLSDRAAGTLPAELLTGGCSPSEAFGKLDGLARMLRSLDCSLPPGKKQGLGAAKLGLPDFTVDLGSTKLTVHKLEIGETASVYRLSANGKDLAFKVAHDPARIDVHGSYSEAGALTFLSQYQIADLVKFHAANPGPNGGWMLNDFVSKPVTQPGVGLKSVLAENGLRLGDDWSANRGPGGIVWDVGGIEPDNVGHPVSLAEFRELLGSARGRMMAGRRMENLPKSEIKEALLLTLDYPDASGQVARSAARLLRDPSDLAEVLHKALQTPGAAGRAAFELDYLRGTPYIRPLYYEALNNSESRIEAAKQIDRLAPGDRKQAIDTAFMYPECRPMAARAIQSLTDAAERAQALKMATGDLGSRMSLALQGTLPVEGRDQSVEGLMNQYAADHGLIGKTSATATAKTDGNPPSWSPRRAKQNLERVQLTARVDTPSLPNFSELSPSTWRSGQFTAEGLHEVKALGVKTIVNLQPETYFGEGVQAQKLGLRYRHVPINENVPLQQQAVDQILEIARDPANYPILWHCWYGQDRTGAAVALVRTALGEKSATGAWDEMMAFGVHAKHNDFRESVWPYLQTVYPSTSL